MEKGKYSSVKSKDKPHATLFVSMQNPQEKRKAILYAIKNSLVVQEEYEKIMNIREKKKKVLAEIKKSMNSLNTKYKEVKNIMPNVKNVISFTEKEFMELDRQMAMVNSNMDSEKAILDQDKNMQRGLKPNSKVPTKKQVKAKKSEKEMTKMERIQHNLDLINNRLKGL